MKLQTRTAYAVLFCLLLLSASCNKTAKDSAQKSAGNPVDQIIKLCKDGKYKEVTKLFLNRRTCKDPNDIAACLSDYDSMSDADKKGVERECTLIVNDHAKYTVGPETEIKDSGPSTGYRYEVDRVDIKGVARKTEWIFVKIGGQYALLDID
jgi:hypothetical protein